MSRARAAVFISACLISCLTAQEPPRLTVPAPPMSLAGPQSPAPVAPPMPGQLQAAPATPPPAPVPLPSLPTTVPGVPLSKVRPVSSTSTSGQFIVHGDELSLRSALSSKCETIAIELRTLLHDKQPWALPIVVLLNTGEKARKAGQSVSTAISQLTHGGFHLQVTVNMRPDLRPADLRKEVVRALLAERILRDQKEISSQRKMLLPDWLFLGTLEALDYRQRARPSALFAALFKSGKIFGIEEIIEASASDIDDALSKTIYQTSCCALVLALLDQPDSGLRVGKFLNALASDPKSERELLNQWFPNLASTDASLNKWWALQLATLASPGVGEPLSPQDTVKALEEALTFRFQAKPSEIPQSSRRVIAARPTSPKPRPVIHEPEGTAAKADEKPADVSVEELAVHDAGKRGFFGRLNPFARNKDSEDEIAAAIQEAALAEAQNSLPKAAKPAAENPVDSPPEPPVPSVPAPASASSGAAPRKPLLGRWFGEEKKDKPAAEDKPAEVTPESSGKPSAVTAPEPAKSATKPEKKEAPKPAKKEDKPAPAKPEAAKGKEEPTPAPEPEEQPETGKKPSALNPLKWFRGGKKEIKEEPAPEAAPASPTPTKEKDKKAALAPQADSLTDQLLSGRPLIAFVYQQVAAEAPAAEPDKEKEKKRLFGLFGKKKEKAETPEAAEPEAPLPPAEKPKAKSKEKPQDAPPPAPAEEPQKDRDKTRDKEKAQEPAAETPTAESEPAADKPKRSLLPFHLFGGKKDEPKDGEKSQEEMPPEAPASLPVSPPEAETAPKPEPVRKPRPAPVSKPTAPKNEAAVAASIPIEDYAAILKRKDLSQILEHNVHALNAIQSRGSVLFRPIAAEYVDVMESILKGRTKGLDARIHTLRARTEEILEKSKAVRDLLDLHEANESPALSGLFEDYLKLPETIQQELPERNDPISRYLDALDKEFSKD